MREDTRVKPNEGFLSHVPTLLFIVPPPPNVLTFTSDRARWLNEVLVEIYSPPAV